MMDFESWVKDYFGRCYSFAQRVEAETQAETIYQATKKILETIENKELEQDDFNSDGIVTKAFEILGEVSNNESIIKQAYWFASEEYGILFEGEERRVQ